MMLFKMSFANANTHKRLENIINTCKSATKCIFENVSSFAAVVHVSGSTNNSIYSFYFVIKVNACT